MTGGSGFVGRWLLAHLRETFPLAHVVAWYGRKNSPPPADDQGATHWARVDVLDRPGVRHALAEASPDWVFHLAGAAHVGQSWSDPATPLLVNAIGTHVLLDELRLSGGTVRVLVTGSSTVYAPSDRELTEEARIAPASPYAVSKLAQELVARRAWSEDGLDVRVTRPFNHIGPGQERSYFAASFAEQLAAIERGLRPPLLKVGNLEARRDLSDVRDTVRAYTALMTSGRPGYPYNVCSARAWTIREILDLLVGQCRVAVQIQPDPGLFRPNDTAVVIGANERLRKDTGWEPVFPLPRTIADIMDDARARVA